jgi:hypothetical protein
MNGLIKKAAAFLLSFFIIIFVFSVSANAADTNAGSKYIKLTAPDIKSGENLIKIGETKYIRYSITLDEYETLYYSDISFDLEFDDQILDLYTTNINLRQIYAYDVTGGEKKNTQNNIICEPEFIDNKISFSSYSTTGMWFRGPVIILYFLVRDGVSVGDVCHVTLSNIKVSVINADGTPGVTGGLIKSKNGTVTVTDSQNFNQGETMNLGSDTSPFKGKGDSGLDTGASDSGTGRTYLNYLIIILVLVIIAGVIFFGVLIILNMLNFSRLPSKKDKKLSDSIRNSKTSDRK